MSYTIITNQKDVVKTLEYCQFDHHLNRFRDPIKQQEAMCKAMETKQGKMALAVHNHSIVGYTIILEPETDERWRGLDFLKMLGVIEVAPRLRNQKVAKKLLQDLFSLEETEKSIVISLECCWHWDLKMTNGDPLQYRSMLKHVLESVGFQEFRTNEPDIACYDVNFMMARVGSEISIDQVNQFTKLAMDNRYLS
ncbi:hypothetical protein [Bacillus sp. T3]|uniref:hypothetical protein n=1 Tax=Bacillus sp. T3 TaxID=467262 RepID=UPI0029815D4F|nr:hypothetical protein [Bacillus sp. T3]